MGEEGEDDGEANTFDSASDDAGDADSAAEGDDVDDMSIPSWKAPSSTTSLVPPSARSLPASQSPWTIRPLSSRSRDTASSSLPIFPSPPCFISSPLSCAIGFPSAPRSSDRSFSTAACRPTLSVSLSHSRSRNRKLRLSGLILTSYESAGKVICRYTNG